MKTCRKCQNKYKDLYIYCPKCGTPCDEKMKYAKVPGEINGDIIEMLKKIWNGILYGLGGSLIFAYLLTINENPRESIFAILFGLSLFQIFYKLASKKANSDKINKFLKIARLVFPVIILIIWMMCFPN